MSNISIALTESKTLRNEKLSEVSNEKALEAINKAKSLVMSFWQGESICTTAQIAEFYEVSEDVVRKVVSRHRVEFESDGLKTLRGKALSDARDIMSLASKTSQETVWNPRSALRLGMVLRESEVAKRVRDVLLDTVAIVPIQSDRIRELELELSIATQQNQSNQAVLAARQLDHTMLIVHGKETVLTLRGMADQIVETEKTVLEVIDQRCGDRRKGMTTTQLKDYLKKRTGIVFKSGAELERRLQKLAPELLDLIQRPVNQSFVNEENIGKAIRILSEGTRQLLIGE